MDSLISQIQTLYSQADDESRRKIQEDIRDLQNSFDTEWEMVVRLATGYLQMALVKIGDDLSLFRMLSSASEPLTLTTLVENTGAAPKMLSHLVHAMAAFGIIKETGVNTFTTNRVTRALADEHVAGAIDHAYDVHAHTSHALPGWLADRKYQDITTNKDIPFQRALKTDLTPFEWLKRNPAQLKAIGHAMAIQRHSNWIDSYPVVAEIADFTAAPESALLVDVGGGFGQQAVAFKNKFPELKGRIVVQDIPETLARAPKVDVIELEAHDFFKEQPIKGAKFYYLRHILHDWIDEDCVKILKALVPAMGPDSRIVIDEVVLPDEKLPWQVAYMDLNMIASLGGSERTKAEYENLLNIAGLKILDVHKYDSKMQSIIIAGPK